MLHNLKRLASLRKGVVHFPYFQKGGRWRDMGQKLLRFAVCLVLAALLLAYLAPKAC